MAGINRTTGKATDLITFSRASGGTALRKISYGSELVENGWSQTGGSGISQSGQTFTLTSAPVSNYVEDASVLTVGKVYQYEYVVSGQQGAEVIRLQNAASSIVIPSSGSAGDGTYTGLFVASDAALRVRVYSETVDAATVTVSVKEVLFDQPDGTLTLFNHPTNIPRIEYAADGTVKGLLIEEQRTNLLTYSEAFDNAAWSKTFTATLAVDATGPDGKTSAVTLIDGGTTGTGPVSVRETVTVATSTTYTFSAFLKADQLSWGRLQLNGFTVANAQGAYFDLVNGNRGTVGPDVTASMVSVGNGWYRCSITFTSDVADTSGDVLIFPAEADNDVIVDLDGTSSILIYGAQLEAGSFPTSYMPTSGSQFTRAPDIASISESAFGYRQNAGTLFVEASEFDATVARFVAGVGYDESNYIGLLYSSGTNSFVQPTAGNIGTVFQPSNTFVKSAAAFNSSSSASATSGTVTTDVGSSPTGSNAVLHLGVSPFSTVNISSCHIKSISYYPRRLSNAQLVQLTA